MTPVVSIIIPAYKAAAFISRTLDCVKAQTFTDYELIVVDDGSPDNTKEVVDQYIADNKINGFCIKQENKKIAAARNTAIKAASGKYMALLDHDDMWYPDKLEKVMRVFRQNPDIILASHALNFVKNGKTVMVYKTGPQKENMYEYLLFERCVLTPSAAVFRKDKCDAIGGFRENPEFNTSEDYDFWLRLSKIGQFHFLPDVLGEYLIVESGASKKIEYHIASTLNMLGDHFDALRDSGVWTKLKMRRRLAMIHRTAARELMKSGIMPKATAAYIKNMISLYPLDIKNIVTAAQWFFKSAFCRAEDK